MTKEFAKDMQDYLKRIDNLKPVEVYELSKRILKDKTLSKKIASGNKTFLQSGVEYFEKYGAEKFENSKYVQEMINHIRKALPHQENFIASKSKDLSLDSKVEGYQRIVNELNNIRGLSLNGLIGLGDEISNDPLLSSVPGQESNIKIIQQMVKKYKELTKKEGVDVAERYLRAASSSGKIRLNTTINILSKSYLPNLISYLNKQKKN